MPQNPLSRANPPPKHNFCSLAAFGAAFDLRAAAGAALLSIGCELSSPDLKIRQKPTKMSYRYGRYVQDTAGYDLTYLRLHGSTELGLAAMVVYGHMGVILTS